MRNLTTISTVPKTFMEIVKYQNINSLEKLWIGFNLMQKFVNAIKPLVIPPPNLMERELTQSHSIHFSCQNVLGKSLKRTHKRFPQFIELSLTHLFKNFVYKLHRSCWITKSVKIHWFYITLHSYNCSFVQVTSHTQTFVSFNWSNKSNQSSTYKERNLSCTNFCNILHRTIYKLRRNWNKCSFHLFLK